MPPPSIAMESRLLPQAFSPRTSKTISTASITAKKSPGAIEVLEVLETSEEETSVVAPGHDAETSTDNSSDGEQNYGDENGHDFNVELSANGSENGSEEWEDRSLFEDLIDGQDLQEPSSQEGSEYCTLQEAQRYKAYLRKVGARTFVDRTVSNGSISAKKLITAFGIKPPACMDGSLDHAYLTLLGIAIQREMSRRIKLEHVNTVTDVVELLEKSENIMVLTGAGISTSLGIPDFRSKEGGLYSLIGDMGLGDPQEVFNLDVFQDDPTYFYSVAKHILPSTRRFSPTHGFIELLQRKGKLLRNYTQNIDNIEQYAGIRPEKLVQCHGSFATATCMKCKHQVPCSKIYDDLKAGRVAKCLRCTETVTEIRQAENKKRKRATTKQKSRKNKYNEDSSGDEEDAYMDKDVGIMKPDIIFFGEQLPERFHRIVDHDRAKVDLLICIGTSLKVAPVSDLTAFIPPNVPQIFISREPCNHIEFDVELLGNQCDDIVTELARQAGWGADFKHAMIPENLTLSTELSQGKTSQYYMQRIQLPGTT